MILVTGSSGMVGVYFGRLRGAFGAPLDLAGSAELDVTDASAVDRRMARHKYTHVVHLAALTDLDACERDPVRAFAVNGLATANLAHACARSGSMLVYLSTAGVFGGNGQEGPFAEDDEQSPPNVYGASKAEGERIARELAQRHLIVRAGWMMGGGTRDRKFVGTIVRTARAGRTIVAVTDLIGSVTFALDLVLAIRDLIDAACTGTFHVVNAGECTRFELAQAIVERLAPGTVVQPVRSSAFPAHPARPRNAVLLQRRLPAAPMRHWRSALSAYLDDWNDCCGGIASLSRRPSSCQGWTDSAGRVI